MKSHKATKIFLFIQIVLSFTESISRKIPNKESSLQSGSNKSQKMIEAEKQPESEEKNLTDNEKRDSKVDDSISKEEEETDDQKKEDKKSDLNEKEEGGISSDVDKNKSKIDNRNPKSQRGPDSEKTVTEEKKPEINEDGIDQENLKDSKSTENSNYTTTNQTNTQIISGEQRYKRAEPGVITIEKDATPPKKSLWHRLLVFLGFRAKD